MSDYTKDITCASKFSTSTTKKSSLFFNALFSMFIDTFDLYNIYITAINNINVSTENIKQANKSIAASCLFRLSIVKTVAKIITTNIDFAVNIIKSSTKSLVVNLTEFIDTMDLYNAYIAIINDITLLSENVRKSKKNVVTLCKFGINIVRDLCKLLIANVDYTASKVKSITRSIVANFTQFIGHLWGQGNWGEFDWANRYIIKKVFKNVNTGIDISTSNTKNVNKNVVTSFLNSLAIIKGLNKYLNNANFGMSTSNTKLAKVIKSISFGTTTALIKCTNVIISSIFIINFGIITKAKINKVAVNKFTATALKLTTRIISTAISFTTSNIRRLADFKFYAASKITKFYYNMKNKH